MQSYQPPPGVSLDVGLLAAIDQRIGLEGTNESIATKGTEAIVHSLFSLPRENSEDGIFVPLPSPITDLPREHPIPKERQPTKWETYALEKGIQKKRRDRLVLVEQTGEYVPRYGKGSKNDTDKVAVIPHKEGMGTDYDPFTQKKKEKKERIKHNDKKRLSNVGRAKKKLSLEPFQALDVTATGPSGKKYLPKKNLKDSLSVVQRSTASVGKFDKKVQNEPKKKVPGRKSKYTLSGGKAAFISEKERSQKIAERVLLKK